MNTIQRKYLRNWIIAISCVAALVLFVVSIALNWTVVTWCYGIAGIIALVGYFVLCIVYLAAIMVYKWRVMGVTDESERQYYKWYWHAILDGAFNYTIGRMQNIKDEDYGSEIAYLMKVKQVPRPRILE